MYLHLSKHVSIAYFRNEAILLDIKKDKYYIFNEQKTKLLGNILNQQWKKELEGSYVLVQKEASQGIKLDQLNHFIKLLKRNRFIDESFFCKPYSKFNTQSKPVGMEEVDWQLPIENSLKASLSWPIFKSLYVLSKVHLGLKLKGFYSLIQSIDNNRELKKPYISPSDEEIKTTVRILNQACLLYPIRTKCLEWAAALTLIGLKKGWQCTLNIGVQNYPFLSHAWAELGGKVIADSSLLPKNMAVILSVPFFNRGITE